MTLQPRDTLVIRELELIGRQPRGLIRHLPPTLGMNTTADCLESPQISELRCEIIRDFAFLEQLSSSWQGLWEADPAAEIFQSFAWNRAWWRGYGANLQLYCIVAWQDATAVGFLPLVSDGETLRFLGAPQADYSDILAPQKNPGTVLNAMLAALFECGDWKECILEHVSAHSRLAGCLEVVPLELRRNLRLISAGSAPTILMGGQPGPLRKLAAKKHLRRHENKLLESGALRFHFLETREEIRRHLPQFFQHQIRRRILHGQASSCLQPEFSAFLQAVVEELDPAQQLRFGVLEWKERPLAYHIGFLANGKFTMYQQAFDVDAWDFSPGEVLLRHLFLYADQNVAREFDFSVGDEPYKARFANHFKPNYTLYIEPRNFAGRLRHSYRALDGRVNKLRRTVKGAVRSNPRAFQLAKQARRTTGDLRARVWSQLSQFKPVIFSQNHTHGAAGVRPAGRQSMPGSGSHAELTSGKLSDLADLYREFPGFQLAGRLAEYRARLRRGDAVYILRMRGKPALIAWTTRNPRNGAAAGPHGLYECIFLGGERKAAYRTLVELLAAQSTPTPA
jgi:CelD/BcsL family acetyltransferase involved in cellulose biosynthesis